MLGVAPGSFRIPVPGLTGEFSTQAIGERPQPYGTHLCYIRRRELAIRFPELVSVDSRAQRLRGYKAIYRLRGVDGDRNRRALAGRNKRAAREQQKENSKCERQATLR